MTPAPRHSQSGNRVTALRWASMLRSLGHRVSVHDRYQGESADMLLALHAKKSAAAVQQFADHHPQRPIVVALTGTDLYCDLPGDRRASRSLELARRLIVLQPLALDRLEPQARAKADVVLQSVPRLRSAPLPRRRSFDLCVVAHLRAVKDPLRAALAARALPDSSRIFVLHAGAALSASLEERARREDQHNSRYQWLGARPRHQARRLIARSQALVVSSRVEGGCHVVVEALVSGTPVLASRIDGTVGQLGDDYPGYFPPGDTRALTELMLRFEEDAAFRHRLSRALRKRAPAFSVDRERRALGAMLDKL